MRVSYSIKKSRQLFAAIVEWSIFRLLHALGWGLKVH